jgi:DNA polymerase II large subunit
MRRYRNRPEEEKVVETLYRMVSQAQQNKEMVKRLKETTKRLEETHRFTPHLIAIIFVCTTACLILFVNGLTQ